MDQASDKPEASSNGLATILVVETDPHVRELEAHFLEQAGYTVGFEQDGDDALVQATKNRPDIIVSEILIPTLDGLSLCRRIKADPRTRDIAVLIFSILSAGGRARDAGADAFLLKPLAEHKLVDAVHRLVEAKRTKRENAT